MAGYSIKLLTVKLTGLVMAVILSVASATPTLANTFSIVNSDSLLFGSFVAGSGGTVTIGASSGARSATGGVSLINSTYRSARFTVSCVVDGGADTCTSTSTYTMSSIADTTLSSGSNSMSVGTFSVYSANTANNTGLLSGGTDILKVGATLTVGGNQAPGSYSGSFSVTVVYQ